MIDLQLLCVIVIANGVPVLGYVLFQDRWSSPLDLGKTFLDGRPVLGSSKTIRGILLSLVATSLGAPILGLSMNVGLLMALLAMTGDCFSSFIKRRMGKNPGTRLPGLDQIPESVFPLLGVREELDLTFWEIGATVALFICLDLFISRWLSEFRMRK